MYLEKVSIILVFFQNEMGEELQEPNIFCEFIYSIFMMLRPNSRK